MSRPVTRTFRIEDAYDEAIRKESEKQGISVNNLINQILKKYTFQDRFLGKSHSITFAPQTMKSILESLDDTKIRALGAKAGSTTPRDRLLLRGMHLERNSALWFISDVLGDYNDWFTCVIHERKDHTLIFLRHIYDEKWSLFLACYLESMFKDILNIDAEIDYTANSLSLKASK